MIVQGDSRDQDAACQALCKLLHHDDSSLKDLGHASQVVKKLVVLMEKEDENGFALATSEQEEYFLMAMLQMCKDDYGCTVLSLVPGVFCMLVKHARQACTMRVPPVQTFQHARTAGRHCAPRRVRNCAGG